MVRNDLARFIHEDPEQLEPRSADILRASPSLSELAERIPGTHYKRYLNLIERTFPDEWVRIHFELLKNSSGKFTTEVVNYLMDKELEGQVAETLERWLNEQNLKGPVLLWIIKNRKSRKYGKLMENILNPRLLNAIFYAIDYEALQNAGNRRIALADAVGDDARLIAELLENSGQETAHDLATMLMLNQGFEELSKKSVLARFIKLYPAIQSLVDGGEGAARQRSLIVSEASFAARKAEYEELVSKKIPENKEAIATAREHGDLRGTPNTRWPARSRTPARPQEPARGRTVARPDDRLQRREHRRRRRGQRGDARPAQRPGQARPLRHPWRVGQRSRASHPLLPDRHGATLVSKSVDAVVRIMAATTRKTGRSPASTAGST
jgi:post-segregation antitoxin (ccd killing protein)